MNQVMNVRFLHDPSNLNRDKRALIEFGGRTESIAKEELLDSLEKDIAMKGFVVNNNISRQDVGDFTYYHFFYFDGVTSRDMQLQVPKADILSNRRIEQIRTMLENEVLKQDATRYHNLKVFAQKTLAGILVGGFMIAGTFGMTYLFLDAWEKESRAHDEYIQSQIPQEMKDEWARQELEEQYPEIVFEDTGRGLH